MSKLIDTENFWLQITSRYKEWVTLEQLQNELGEAPTVDAAPIKHGYWLMSIGAYARRDGTYCSECGWSWADNIAAIQLHPVLCKIETNFCPNCGAKMRWKNE